MKILATVDTVATNIIGKIAIAKSSYLRSFHSKLKIKKCELIRTMFLEPQFACFAGILPRFASESVYKAGCVTLAIK